jgi:hypothetical protein
MFQPSFCDFNLVSYCLEVNILNNSSCIIPVFKCRRYFQPYRTAPLVMPGPKTINEVGAGAPIYQPVRGPQYNTLPARGSFQKVLTSIIQYIRKLRALIVNIAIRKSTPRCFPRKIWFRIHIRKRE